MRLIVVAACCLASCCASVWPTYKGSSNMNVHRDSIPPEFTKDWPNEKGSSSKGRSSGDEASYSFPSGKSQKRNENSGDAAVTKNDNSSLGSSIAMMLEKLNINALNLSKSQPGVFNIMGMQGGSNNRRSPSEESPDEATRDRSSPYQSAADKQRSVVDNKSQNQNPATSQKGSASTNVKPQVPGSGKAANNVNMVAAGYPGTTQKKAGSFSPTTPPLKNSNQGKKQQSIKMSG